METAFRELHTLGYPAGNLFYFESPAAAAEKLKKIIKKEDLILVKGSQGMRMEKIVEEVMLEPQNAQFLLCRQDSEWKNSEQE